MRKQSRTSSSPKESISFLGLFLFKGNGAKCPCDPSVPKIAI